MATKKKKVAKSKKASKSLLGKKGLLFGLAIILAIVVVFGLQMFAGSNKPKGRVFSWKEGAVKNNYSISQTNPDAAAYQQVYYKINSWSGDYYSVYTEKTNPAIQSRVLKAGVSGEDVSALKAALRSIGKGYVLPPTTDNKYNGASTPVVMIEDRCPAMKLITTTNAFDASTENAIKSCIAGNNISTGFDTFVNKDGKVVLDKFRIARIFTLATHPGLLKDKGVAFNGTDLEGVGKVFANSEINAAPVVATEEPGSASAPDTTTADQTLVAAPVATQTTTAVVDACTVRPPTPGKWGLRKVYYNGQANYGESPVQSQKIPQGIGFISATVFTKNQYSRSFYNCMKLKKGMKGDDVKNAQEMLIYLKNKYPSTFKFTGLKANGNYDKATIAAVKEYQKYRGAVSNGFINAKTLQLMLNDIAWPVYK